MNRCVLYLILTLERKQDLILTKNITVNHVVILDDQFYETFKDRLLNDYVFIEDINKNLAVQDGGTDFIVVNEYYQVRHFVNARVELLGSEDVIKSLSLLDRLQSIKSVSIKVTFVLKYEIENKKMTLFVY